MGIDVNEINFLMDAIAINIKDDEKSEKELIEEINFVSDISKNADIKEKILSLEHIKTKWEERLYKWEKEGFWVKEHPMYDGLKSLIKILGLVIKYDGERAERYSKENLLMLKFLNDLIEENKEPEIPQDLPESEFEEYKKDMREMVEKLPEDVRKNRNRIQTKIMKHAYKRLKRKFSEREKKFHKELVAENSKPKNREKIL